MSELVLLTPLTPTPGGDNIVIVNLDRVITIRPRVDGGSHVMLISQDGAGKQLDIAESPRDIVALARLDAPFSTSDWKDELEGQLSGFHQPEAGVLRAALVDGETGALATFALDADSRSWVFTGIEEPADDLIAPAEADVAWNAKQATPSNRLLRAPTEDASDRERLAAGALRALDRLSSKNAPGTSNGKLACAWAVNEIAQESLGRRIGGGLSTIRMYGALRLSADIMRDAPEPGDIVISPTQGRVVGHVGIVLDADGRIASNSSARALFVQNYSLASWREAFVTRKRLEMHVFRIRDA
jgi:hypothetical protein